MIMFKLPPPTRAEFFLKRAAASADAARAANAFRSPEAEEAFRVLERLWRQIAESEARVHP
jgi:hypothetical protein